MSVILGIAGKSSSNRELRMQTHLICDVRCVLDILPAGEELLRRPHRRETRLPNRHVNRIQEICKMLFMAIDNWPRIGRVEEFPIAESGIAKQLLRLNVDFGDVEGAGSDVRRQERVRR